MLVTSADVASLDALLIRWESAEYVATVFVILACVGEFVAEFTEIRTKEWRDKLGKMSLLVLIAALSLELVSLVRTNNLSGREIALLGIDLQQEKQRTATAESNSAQAQYEAAKANERAGKLEKEAAELTASNLRLEGEIAPRRLSERQQHGLAELTAFAGRIVGVKSYSSDAEGLILATQAIDALTKSKIRIEDNRLTMTPAGSVIFGVSVEGPDEALVAELKRILSIDGNLLAVSYIASPNRGFSASVSFGVISGGVPPAATIIVGAKPIK